MCGLGEMVQDPTGAAVRERREGLIHQFANTTTTRQRGRGNVFSLMLSASLVRKEQESRILQDLPDDLCSLRDDLRSLRDGLQGYLAHQKTSTPIGTPSDPVHRPTVGSEVGAFPVSEVPLYAAYETSNCFLCSPFYVKDVSLGYVGRIKTPRT